MKAAFWRIESIAHRGQNTGHNIFSFSYNVFKDYVISEQVIKTF